MDQIIVRPGRLDDEPHVKEFTRNTYAWGDYVGEAYAGWIAQVASGKGDVYVAVAAQSGKPVGVIRTDYLSPEEAWFEGIRVHPGFRRLGIGRILTAASIEKARLRGARTCRVAIDTSNEKSTGLARSMGFEPVASIIQFEGHIPPPSAPQAQSFLLRAAAAEDASAVYQAMSREMRYVGSDYHWRKVTPQNVERMICDCNLRLATDRSGSLVAGAALSDTFIDYDAESRALCGELASVFGDVAGILALVEEYDLRAAEAASRQGLPWRLCITCERGSPAVGHLPLYGFSERVDEEICLWEMKMDG
jgi:ribosomal protein S18 acetylase RimI-like enzyme